MSKLSIAVALTLIASCAPDAGAPGTEPSTEPTIESTTESTIEQHHRSPVLSGAALWTAEGPTGDTGRCFGAAVAVGDLDGDGYRDVIVGESPCLFTPVTQGRLAIFRGGPSLPSTTPVWTDLDWQNPPFGGTQMTLAVGDIDGDHHDDLLVRSRAGVQVFAGIINLGAPLGAPSFRVPGTGTFGAAALADVNGDHRDDIVSLKSGAITVWLSTPGAPGGPFTAGRIITPAPIFIAPGDTNGDGKDDLLLLTLTGTQLLRGCSARERGCDGGLSATPAWTFTQPVIGMVPDLNHDGLSEAIVSEFGFDLTLGAGRIWLHLSDRSSGGLSATPAWTMIGDPNYPLFGGKVVVPGDLDGDHRSTEFVVPGSGRVYAFFPKLHGLATMKPGFAWPREDFVQDQIDAGDLMLGSSSHVVEAAGDVNRDHFDDLVVGDPPNGAPRPGRVSLISGGRRPAHDDPPPFLLGAPVCSLPQTGKPDLTVDAGALARSLFVDRAAFASDACEISEGCVGGPGVRRLLRFTTSLANYGGAPAIIPGPDTAPELYHLNVCEGEFELENFAQYDLVDAAGSHVAAGRKQSIFPIDIAPNCIDNGPATDYFPDAGLSPGWSDVYVADIPCQWLDTTDVPDGRYTLRISVDTNHIVEQDDVRPDTVSIDLELAGDRVTVLR